MLDRLRQQTWPIQAQFLLYSLALLLPVLIFSGLMIVRSASLERAAMEQETTETVRSIALAIDRVMASTTTTLKALASSPSLVQGELEAFYKQAIAALEVGGNHFYLTGRHGKQLMNTRVPWGTDLPDRSNGNWEQVFETGKPEVSGVYHGRISGTEVFSVSVPVMIRGKGLYVLSASISPNTIVDILTSLKLNEHRIATVIDRAGNIVARSEDAETYIGKPSRLDAQAGSQLKSGVWRTTDARGKPVLRAIAVSQLSGWLVSTTVPLSIANRPIVHSWILIATLAVSFTLLSALLAFLFGRRIAKPVRQLVDEARALGRGEKIVPIKTSISEIRAVAEAMAGASETRRYMEASLRESEDRLRLALASADTGTWDWDLATHSLAWDARMRQLWGLGPTDPITYERFIAAIHADDREAILSAIARAQDPNNPLEYDVDHRVRGIHDGVERWVAVRGKAHFNDGVAVRMTGTARDITEYKHWEEHTQLLMREVTHRSKNLLAVIQAMARQTKIGSKTVAEFETRFSGRLQALAASQDLLVQRDWQGVSMVDLVRSQLGHHTDSFAKQIVISGADLLITPEAAQNIGLAVHELSTNAAKYGALSVPEGCVMVRWACEADGAEPRFRMTWTERNGPAVAVPSHKGFGQVVMEQLTGRALQGEAKLHFDPDGVRWTLDIPVEAIRWDDTTVSTTVAASRLAQGTP
jgi:PAS domain S-box-containing protein